MVQWEVPPTRRLAFLGVLMVVVLSLLVTLKDFRWGGYLLSGALAGAAVIRATLPEKYCLGLLVRSRRLDVMFDAGLALAVLITVHVVPD
jgi:hypothetical protein